MNAPARTAESAALAAFADRAWDERIVPVLTDYIASPAKSPMFDADWQQHGHIERVVRDAAAWVERQPLEGLVLAVAGPLAPDLAVNNGLKAAWISRDAAVVQAYEDDPLVHDRITPRLVRFIVDAGATVLAAAPRWALPTLLMYAGSDRCVAPRGSAAFAARAPRGVVEVRAFPQLYHEIFNEPEHHRVYAVLDGWLAAPHLTGAVKVAL